MNSDELKVAVVIPCYNAARFLPETLDSVLAQNVPTEVVAVDDGSTDGTAGILHSYADRITVLRHEGGRNRGSGASRNLAIVNTSAPFVSFLDADDLWDPDKLAIEARVLREHSEVGVVVSGCRAIDSQGTYLYDFPPFPAVSDRDLPEALLLDCFIQTPGQVLLRRSLLDQVGLFDPVLVATEDHDMWVRLAERARFAFLPNHTVAYRKHGESLSQEGAKRMWQSGFDLLAKAERRRDYGATATRRRAVLHYRLAQCAWRERAYVKAGVEAFRASLLDPRRAWAVVTTSSRGQGSAPANRPHPDVES